MSIILGVMLIAMTSADAVATLLNSPNACGVKTYANALKIVEREAKEGKPLQQFVIGIITEDKMLAGKYIAASKSKIETMAKERDNPLAWYLLSMEGNDLSLLQRAAKGGNVQALNALGTIATQESFNRNISSNDLERVLAKSFNYFKQAAACRDANGMVNLGTCYLRGFGCDQDMELAFRCYEAAAELGHPEAMENLSAAYQFGHGVRKSHEKSLYWAMKARAMKGDEAAVKWLRERR